MPYLRSGLRRLARPLFRPAWRRVWARIEWRIAPVEARVAAIEASVVPEDRTSALEREVTNLEATWRQHVPNFLNAIGSVQAFGQTLRALRADLEEVRKAVSGNGALGALRTDLEEVRKAVSSNGALGALRTDLEEARGRLGRDVINIWERIEFVRREILFELAYGKETKPQSVQLPTIAARVIAPEKVERARAIGSLRLNLGCGHIALADYINVDLRELPGVDVVADVGDLPFEKGTVAEIFSAHLVEHFPVEAMRRRLLPYWRELLLPGGTFRAVTPDAAAMVAAAATGTYPFEEFREVVFGAQDYAGDFHYNLFTPQSMRELLLEANFHQVEAPIVGRRNGKCFEFEINARR